MPCCELTLCFNCIRYLCVVWQQVALQCREGKAGPFFIMIYVDDEIVAAKGRGGGIAIWQRAKPEWELKAGVTL